MNIRRTLAAYSGFLGLLIMLGASTSAAPSGRQTQQQHQQQQHQQNTISPTDTPRPSLFRRGLSAISVAKSEVDVMLTSAQQTNPIDVSVRAPGQSYTPSPPLPPPSRGNHESRTISGPPGGGLRPLLLPRKMSSTTSIPRAASIDANSIEYTMSMRQQQPPPHQHHPVKQVTSSVQMLDCGDFWCTTCGEVFINHHKH